MRPDDLTSLSLTPTCFCVCNMMPKLSAWVFFSCECDVLRLVSFFFSLDILNTFAKTEMRISINDIFLKKEVNALNQLHLKLG